MSITAGGGEAGGTSYAGGGGTATGGDTNTAGGNANNSTGVTVRLALLAALPVLLPGRPQGRWRW